jgi:sarcosine oxidase, subunit gamma
MPEPVSALPGARYSGLVEVAEAGLQGMIVLRGEIGGDAVAQALRDTFGLTVPDQRRIVAGERAAVAWMAPDELLILTDHAVVPEMLAALEAELKDSFATLADVSDARAVFTLRGAQARDVLAKACPVDFADFPVGSIRRTRAAQVAAAIWRSGEDEFTLVCFRSVARYMWDLLTTLARPGGEVGLYR